MLRQMIELKQLTYVKVKGPNKLIENLNLTKSNF